MSVEKKKVSKKKIISPQQEKFCVEVANGKSFVDAYIAAFPKAEKWKREVAHTKGYAMSTRDYIVERIQQIKQPLREKAEKEHIWTHEDSVKLLAEIARFGEKDSDRISAIKSLNELLGLNAPKKLDHSSSDGTMTPKPTIDVTKLSDSALEEIMNATIK